MAPQLTGTKLALNRVDSVCKARATSSLPVPLSPKIKTLASLEAA